MLAFILLVVLGGGIGLMAVSLAESSKPATVGNEQTRARIGPDPQTPDAAEPPAVPLADAPDATSVVIEAQAPPVPVPFRVAPDPVQVPSRRPDPRTVPRAYTAVEGTFADVSRVPVWRKGLSVVGILLITIAAGAGIATLSAAVIGAAAEVLDNAIG